jgi:hypothetical protein
MRSTVFDAFGARSGLCTDPLPSLKPLTKIIVTGPFVAVGLRTIYEALKQAGDVIATGPCPGNNPRRLSPPIRGHLYPPLFLGYGRMRAAVQVVR